jgi:hypothetical protein
MKTAHRILTLILFSAFLSAIAQTTGGSISGRVVDASEAAIPGARVTIQSQATGQTRILNTNETGFYNAPGLSQGGTTQRQRAPDLVTC